MSYQAKEWKDTVYDDEGNLLQKGSKMLAADMNRIDNAVEQLINEKIHVGKNAPTKDEIFWLRRYD